MGGHGRVLHGRMWHGRAWHDMVWHEGGIALTTACVVTAVMPLSPPPALLKTCTARCTAVMPLSPPPALAKTCGECTGWNDKCGVCRGQCAGCHLQGTVHTHLAQCVAQVIALGHRGDVSAFLTGQPHFVYAPRPRRKVEVRDLHVARASFRFRLCRCAFAVCCRCRRHPLSFSRHLP